MAHLGAPVVVDGSHGEGGGSLVRTALCMAALTQQALRLENVRGGTNYPGLDVEDVLLIRALRESCAAEVTGVEPGSLAFSFLPTRRPQGLRTLLSPEAGQRRMPNGPVLLNALAPLLARTGVYSRVEAQGETYGHHSLSFDYFANVTVEAYRRMGVYLFPELSKAGFGREARGACAVEIEPSAVEGVRWDHRGRLLACRAIVATAGLPPSVAERGLAHLRSLGQYSGVPIQPVARDLPADRPGAHVTVWAEYENGLGGAAAMGARGLRMETLAQTAFEEVLGWIGTDATVDPFLADQILVPSILADEGCSFKTSRLTQRFLTSVWVIKQFLPIHLTVKGVLDGPGTVTVRK